MTHSPFDWTDIQYVLTVAQTGSLVAAARVLRVSHSTVQRRVSAFERSRGLRLFDRLPTGYALTSAGEDFLAVAETMSEIAGDLERRLAGRDLRLEGELRITTTDTLMASLLPPILRAFQATHPAVDLEVSVATTHANLTRRDADVAIRATSAPPEALVGRRIARIGYALYSQARGAETAGQNLAKAAYVGPAESLADTVVARWMRAKGLLERARLRCDTVTAMASAAAAGVGLAPLPCYLGDGRPDLIKMKPGLIADMPRSDLWVLSHADLRRSARVRAFTEFTCASLSVERGRIEGC